MIIFADFPGGVRIDKAIKEAKIFAKKNDVTVQFTFNGIILWVSKRSIVKNVIKEYGWKVRELNKR
jgi:hypothetical protein